MIATSVADAAVSAAIGLPATVRLGLSPRGVIGGHADRVTLRLRDVTVAGLVLEVVHVDARCAWIAPGWPPRLRAGPIEVAVTLTQGSLDDWLLADALPFRLRLREGGLVVRTGAAGIRLAELHAGIAVEDGRVVVVAERADVLGVTIPAPPASPSPDRWRTWPRPVRSCSRSSPAPARSRRPRTGSTPTPPSPR